LIHKYGRDVQYLTIWEAFFTIFSGKNIKSIYLRERANALMSFYHLHIFLQTLIFNRSHSAFGSPIHSLKIKEDIFIILYNTMWNKVSEIMKNFVILSNHAFSSLVLNEWIVSVISFIQTFFSKSTKPGEILKTISFSNLKLHRSEFLVQISALETLWCKPILIDTIFPLFSIRFKKVLEISWIFQLVYILCF
jgi:hypothetical protein